MASTAQALRVNRRHFLSAGLGTAAGAALSTPAVGAQPAAVAAVPATATGAYEVLRPAEAAEPVQFAAAELARYVRQTTGRPVREGVLGHSAEPCSLVLRAAGQALGEPPRPDTPIGPEGYTLATRTGQLSLRGGSPRGLVSAVYGWLEGALGCRWYGPYEGDAVVPRVGATALDATLGAPAERSEHPDFAFRMREFRDWSPAVPEADARLVDQVDWWAKLRMSCFLFNFHFALNRPLWERWCETVLPEVRRRGLLLGIGEHGSYSLFLNPAKYATDHPDWYCEIEGRRLDGFVTPSGGSAQFCTTNEGAVATYLDNLLAFAAAHPDLTVWYPAPNDVAGWCQCARCRGSSISDRYLEFTNRIAAALSAVRPAARVLHLAYANHRLPPDRVVPHPAVDLDVACWGRDFTWPLRDPRTMPDDPTYLDAFMRWVEICREQGGASRVIYHCKLLRQLWLGPHLLPLPVVADDLRFARELGLEGFDFPLESVGLRTKALNTYVVARQCWAVEDDAAQRVEEHFRLVFGDHATAARAAVETTTAALPDRRYGSSFALPPGDGLPGLWSDPGQTFRAGPAGALRDHAQRAAEGFGAALAALPAPGAADRTPPLDRLATSLRWCQLEQLSLQRLAEVVELLGAEAPSRPEAEARLSAADAAVAALAGAYRLDDDLSGLLWAGATHPFFAEAVEACRARLEEQVAATQWVTAGGWVTADFPDAATVVEKWIDVSALRLAAGPLFVRWIWRSGQLGIAISETSLWREADGERVCVSRDAHGGFAGATPSRTRYRLRLDQVVPGARYLLLGRLQAVCGRGTVAERGTGGVVEVGLPAVAED